MPENRVQDGLACSGCGLPNYSGLCPHCRGDQDAYELELVPPFPSSLSDEPKGTCFIHGDYWTDDCRGCGW